MTQGDKIHQALDVHMIFVSSIKSRLTFVFSWDLVPVRKIKNITSLIL